MQFIFLVESDSKSKSDYQYIYASINYFYSFIKGEHKFSPIYMSGKGNYNKFYNKVNILMNKYKKTGQSVVFICTDIDDSTNPSYELNQDIQSYCKEKGYQYIWFNKDIEEVYLGYSVSNSDKTDVAKKFTTSQGIKNVDCRMLSKNSVTSKKTSNILYVLDKFLTRKK